MTRLKGKLFVCLSCLCATLVICSSAKAFDFKKSIKKITSKVNESAQQITQKPNPTPTTSNHTSSNKQFTKQKNKREIEQKTAPTEKYEIVIPEEISGGIVAGDFFCCLAGSSYEVWNFAQNKQIASVKNDTLKNNTGGVKFRLSENGAKVCFYTDHGVFLWETSSNSITSIELLDDCNLYLSPIISSSGRFLLVEHDETRSFSVIDTSSKKVILSEPSKIGKFDAGIFAKDEKIVYVNITTRNNYSYLLGYDLETGKRVFKQKITLSSLSRANIKISQHGRFLATQNLLVDLKNKKISRLNSSKTFGFYGKSFVVGYQKKFRETGFDELEKFISNGKQSVISSPFFHDSRLPDEFANGFWVITKNVFYSISKTCELGETIISISKMKL